MRFLDRMRLRQLVANARARFAAIPLELIATVSSPGDQRRDRLGEIDARALQIIAQVKEEIEEFSAAERNSKHDLAGSLEAAQRVVDEIGFLWDEFEALATEQEGLLANAERS